MYWFLNYIVEGCVWNTFAIWILKIGCHGGRDVRTNSICWNDQRTCSSGAAPCLTRKHANETYPCTTDTHTWSFNRLFPHSCGHTQRVLAPIDGHSQLTHDLTHGFAGIPQTGSLPGKLGSPHPVPTALHVLKHTTTFTRSGTKKQQYSCRKTIIYLIYMCDLCSHSIICSPSELWLWQTPDWSEPLRQPCERLLQDRPDL